MPRARLLHDRDAILDALREHRALHVYAIGDLDDRFFPFTSWYALAGEGRARHVVLVYSAGAVPTVLALAPERDGDVEELRALLRAVLPVLPRRFYLHVTPGAGDALADEYELRPHGLHRKMLLADPGRAAAVDTTGVEGLRAADRSEVEAFYGAAYPGNWFDPWMLETGRYVGVRVDGALASVAGVHVYSPAYRVAALGNIATHAAFRGRGLGRKVVAALCRDLARDCDTIGLNVAADNGAAIRLYEGLGFVVCGAYEEHEVVARRQAAP